MTRNASAKHRHLPYWILAARQQLTIPISGLCGALLAIGLVLQMNIHVFLTVAGAAGYGVVWLAFIVCDQVIPNLVKARFVKKVQALCPGELVFGAAGYFFSPGVIGAPPGTTFGVATGWTSRMLVVAVSKTGLTMWVPGPNPERLYFLPWIEVGNVAVEHRRVEVTGRFQGPVKSVICFSLRNETGVLPNALCLLDSWRRESLDRVAEQAALMARTMAYRTGWSDTQHYTI